MSPETPSGGPPRPRRDQRDLSPGRPDPQTGEPVDQATASAAAPVGDPAGDPVGDAVADAGRHGHDAVAAAARELWAVADARWVQIADRVITTALTAPRRSLPVRAQASSGPVYLSEHALVSVIRAALDGALQRCALREVHLHVDRTGGLESLDLVLVAQYGQPLLPMADLARDLALQVLRENLGTVSPQPSVRTMWVHFDDVTIGDPNTVSD